VAHTELKNLTLASAGVEEGEEAVNAMAAEQSKRIGIGGKQFG
jgi:hypothetical protein